MKPLRRLLDRLHPLFEKGRRLEKLYPAFEAIDTFLYSPGGVTRGRTHVRDALDLKRVMSLVIVSLAPCVFMAMYNTGLQANLALAEAAISEPAGWRAAVLSWIGVPHDAESWFACTVFGALYFLPAYIVTMVVGLTWEGVFASVRKHEINEGFFVTGLLFPLTLPPTIPLWQIAVGISFGVVIGKEVFGGTGKNFLNPALTARAFLYFAYPAEITGDSIWTGLGPTIDGFSGATPLGVAADSGMSSVHEQIDFMTAFLGFLPGSMGETSVLACLAGAVILIATGIGSWRIMAGVVVGALGLSYLLFLISSDSNPMFTMPPHWHLVVGGFAFGTVFMATDPVSAAMTRTGMWIYGALIGVMTILIRVVNPAFPEGIMLAILFGNVFAPVIDHYVVKANIRRRLARTNG